MPTVPARFFPMRPSRIALAAASIAFGTTALAAPPRAVPAVPAENPSLADGEEDSAQAADIVVFGRGENKIGVAGAASEGSVAGKDLLRWNCRPEVTKLTLLSK